jgi:hypothetical protein
MKARLFLTMLLIVTANLVRAQFALEKTYDFSLTVSKINDTEYKYYLMDVVKSECRIYNLDHTLWKTISISLPADYYLYDVKFVTQNLFNSDSNIELWFSAYNWVTVGSDGYYRYISKVIDEKGNALASIANGAIASLVKTGEEQYKMTVYAYDNSFWPGAVKTHIFSIPGTQTAAFHATGKLDDPYPNPADDLINIPLMSSETSGMLQVFSLNGRLMKEEKLEGQPVYQLGTTGWSPGTYTYRVLTPNGTTDAKKFVIR